MGRNILGLSEREFWKGTPKKLDYLYKTYKHLNGIEDKESNEEFIDNVLF